MSETHMAPSAADVLQRIAAAGASLAQGTGSAQVRIELRDTREFGMVLSAAIPDADAAAFRPGQALVGAAAALADAEGFFARWRQCHVGRHLGERVDATRWQALFAALLTVAADSAERDARNTLSLALDLRLGDAGEPLVVGASGHSALRAPLPLPRPAAKIDKLLHPKSIGLIGASATKMNFGRIILKNLIASGYDKSRMVVVRPGESEIDGVRCVDSLKSLDGKLDLFVVAVAADAVFDLVDEVIELDAAESVLLIPGGLGETEKGREAAQRMVARINANHGRPGGGPVFLGGNCLGIVSHPGGFDSWFIPQERLPKTPKKARRNSALLSQSGAFMITRLSRNPWLDPAYMAALGNQGDLTHGDMLGYFAGRDDIDLVGLYIEGFRDGDGLAFARAVRKATVAGKQVVVYKAGRTAAGAAAARGHTASTAGDHALCASVLRQAGAIVAEDMAEFDDLFNIANVLQGKRIGGNRLGAVSGAGFETVGMADSIGTSLEMATLTEPTLARLGGILAAKGLDALMEVRNPFDINPGADDEAHLLCAEAMLDDPNVDAVVVGLDPASPAMRALDRSAREGFDIHSDASIVRTLPALAAKCDKPVIGIVDGGSLYDAMAAKLMDGGVCVFRSCGRGVEALAKYIEARRQADAIRQNKN